MEAIVNTEEDGTRAAETLATIRTHQERTRRAARVPLWMYVVMFVLAAGLTAISDFVGANGSEVPAIVVLILLVVTLLATFTGRSAPLSRLRGVQGRQSFEPRVFGAVLLVAGAGAWLVSRYGTAAVHDLAAAVGLGAYPNTVAGLLYGAAITVLFAAEQLLLTKLQRRRKL